MTQHVTVLIVLLPLTASLLCIRKKSKSGSPAQGDLLLRQRHVNAVFYGECGGGAAAEYQIDRRKQRPCQDVYKRQVRQVQVGQQRRPRLNPAPEAGHGL